MSTSATFNARVTTLKKVLPIVALATAMLLVAGFSYLSVIHKAEAAAKPSDFGLTEGNTISAAGSDDPDVYIINDWGYKRLFLNPVIFGFYGHLGGFANVKSVSPSTRDAFGTSGLFRNCETNDQKVYGVETTGEDTGILHWVNTSGAQAVADDPNFFKKVFCINNNEFNWYSQGSAYTSVNQVPNYSRTPGSTPNPTGTPSTPPPASGTVSLSLSSQNPAASTVTKNAQDVTYLAFTANGSNTTLNQVTIKRGGAGATGDFSNVYIYDGARRVSSGKTLSSSDGTVTFINLNIPVNGPHDIQVVADMAGSSANGGDVNNLSLTDAQFSSGSVTGLPITGNNVTLSGSSSGTISLDKVGSLANPNVGAKQAQITEFKLTASTEAASLRRIQLILGGSAKPGDLTNLTMKSGSNSWNGTIDKDGHIVFDMSSAPLLISKGNNTIFNVYADLAGKKNDTIQVYFELAADIFAVGDQYGYGMAATITNIDTSSEAFQLTLQGGVLTLAQDNSLTSATIGTNTSDTLFLKYTMNAITGIEVRKTKLVLCKDNAGNGTYDNNSNGSGWNDLNDIKVSDDKGNILVGPADGSAFTGNDTDSCPNSATGASKTFTDVFELKAGETKNMKITGDVMTSNTGSGVDISSNDVIKIILNSYGDLTGTSGDVTAMKYSGTNTAVTSSDIVPSADISGPNMTVQSSTLTLGLSGSPISQTYVRGTTGVNAVGFTFQAAQASPLKITDVTLSGYVRDNTSDNGLVENAWKLGVGTNGDSNLKVGNLVQSVSLYEAESGKLLSSGPTTNNLSNSTGTIVFNSLNWDIPGGATRTLLVRTNLSSNATSGSSDFVAFDIAATTDVTALDGNNNTINPGSATPNGTTSPTRVLTVANSGSVTVSLAPGPQKHALYWGQTGDEVSRFTFNATNEGQYIERLTLASLASASGTAATTPNNARDTIRTVYLTYTNKAGQVLTSSQTLTNGASANFGFTGDARPYIPKDSSTDIAAKVDIKTKSDGLGNSQNNVAINLSLSDTFNNSYTDGLRLVGEGSGAIIDGSSTINDVAARDMYVFRVFPQLTQIPVACPCSLTGTPDVFKFTVTAQGLNDSYLFFNNVAAGSGSIQFMTIASGEWSATGSTTYEVYGLDDNIKYDSGTLSGDARGNTISVYPRASLSFAFANNTLKIQGGQSKSFRITLTNPNTNYSKTANGTNGRAADYFQLILKDQSSTINWVANTTGSSTDSDTQSTTGVLRSLPLNGSTFQR